MTRRSFIHYRLKRRKINPEWLSTAIPVKDFAVKTSYTTRAIYSQIAKNRLVAYRIKGRWLVPYPPIYR